MFRYFGLIWNPSNPTCTASAARLARRLRDSSTEWNVVLNAPGLQVSCRTGRPMSALTVYPLTDRSGVVLGTVFRRSNGNGQEGMAHNAAFNQEETAKILSTRGRLLIDGYWGRYVAFIGNDVAGTTWVLKDPTGRLPCFVAACAGVSLVFSYMPDCVELGALPFKIDWSYVAARIALGSGRPDDTGIEGVSEVCGGECLEFHSGRQARHLYWNPATFLSGEAIEDPLLAARSLRATTKACVHAWASTHDTFLHRLSGGLDSSIVLSCLADAPSRPRIRCLTYYRQGGASDERPWARLAAQRSGCELVEYARDPHIDFSALSRMRLSASPPLTSSFLETDGFERQLTAQYHATAISTGDGGDSLFGSTSARFSVLDYVRRHGLRPALLLLASDVALLRNQSVWKVLSKTLRYALFNGDREDAIHLRDARKLACAEIREPVLAKRSSFGHPWFRSGRLPPAANEILAFLTIPDLFYPPLFSPDNVGAESIFPLLSQPLVELCVAIPSYVLFDQGRDRGLARRAFADDVPGPILARTWKDRVQGFPEEILRANLAYFRELLLDGTLVKERYLDRGALESTLSGRTIKETASVGEILDHVLVEAWLQSWILRNGARAVA
jgi:asparagine synthase (glutamine-hydrolysing)